jgi:hypothetical protein
MDFKNVDDLIKKFRGYVIQQSRSNLTKGGKNVTKKLYDSLKGEIVTDKGFSIVGFSMDDYGSFQDKGVKGKTSSAKAPNSPFQFKGGGGKGKGGLTQGINKWVRQRGFQFRSKKEGSKGRFLSYEATAFLITRSIFHKGIKPSLFFTKPFEVAKNRYLGKELIKAFKADIDTIVSYNLRPK